MKISAKVKNFYYGMSGFSIGLLALALELSVIGYLVSIFMNIFSLPCLFTPYSNITKILLIKRRSS